MKLCALLLLFVTYVHGFSCPDNWHLVGETCYKTNWNERNHGRADWKCRSNYGDNARLAIARDPELIAYLSENLCIGESGKNCWVGAKNDIDADTVEWLDGEVTSFAAAPWGDGQPINYPNDNDPMCMGVVNGLEADVNGLGLANGKCKWNWVGICEIPASVSDIPTPIIEPPVTEDPYDFEVDPEDCRFEVSHGMSTDGAVCNMDFMDLDACKDHCFSDPNCVAIDWNKAPRPWMGCRCWTHMEHFTETFENPNVDHYRTMDGNC